MKKLLAAGIILLLVSCQGSDRKAGQFPWASHRERRAAEEALEAQEYQTFLHQNKKDELQKLTENSFFDSGLKPLAGRPVLLAAGVKTWNRKRGESDDSPNMVKFEIVQGKGTLAFFTEYTAGPLPAGISKRRLETLAMEGYEAFVWLITDPYSRDEVVVRATLAPAGARAAFIDPQSEVLFHVHPADIPAAEKKFDVRTIRLKMYENDSVPHAETADNFIFTYPSSIGVYKLDPTASLYGAGRMKLFHQNPKGEVAEAPDWEEKHTWKWEREKWHTIPPDLQGFLTHADAKGERLGVLTYTQYDPVYGGRGNDQFRQGRWELGEYWNQALDAGPEDSWTLKTQQEDSNSPIAVEASRTHHSRLQRNHGVYYWGETVHWISATGNLFSVYGLLFKRINFFQAGNPPKVDALKTQLAGRPHPTAPAPLDKTIDAFWKEFGLVFQDITPEMEKHFQKLGHPPGLVVTRVDPQSPLGLSGLMPEDVVLMANWQPTFGASELQKVLANLGSSESLNLIFWRQGSYHWLETDSAQKKMD